MVTNHCDILLLAFLALLVLYRQFWEFEKKIFTHSTSFLERNFILSKAILIYHIVESALKIGPQGHKVEYKNLIAEFVLIVKHFLKISLCLKRAVIFFESSISMLVSLSNWTYGIYLNEQQVRMSLWIFLLHLNK